MRRTEPTTTEWRIVVVDGRHVYARESYMAASLFSRGFHFTETNPLKPTIDDLLIPMKTIDVWCRDQFGPPARFRRDKTYSEGSWWRTEGVFRFRNDAYATAFKLVWL